MKSTWMACLLLMLGCVSGIAKDNKTNKYKLSHKALLPKPEGWVERERKPREGGKPHGDRREPRRK